METKKEAEKEKTTDGPAHPSLKRHLRVIYRFCPSTTDHRFTQTNGVELLSFKCFSCMPPGEKNDLGFSLPSPFFYGSVR